MNQPSLLYFVIMIYLLFQYIDFFTPYYDIAVKIFLQLVVPSNIALFAGLRSNNENNKNNGA